MPEEHKDTKENAIIRAKPFRLFPAGALRQAEPPKREGVFIKGNGRADLKKHIRKI